MELALSVILLASGGLLMSPRRRCLRYSWDTAPAAHDLSPTVPVKFTTMEALMAEHVAASQFRAWLVGLFAAVALCLAIVGIFGVMVYVVNQRTTEIGRRVALGARPGQVLWLLLKRGLVITGDGLSTGLVTSAVTTHFWPDWMFAVIPAAVGHASVSSKSASGAGNTS